MKKHPQNLGPKVYSALSLLQLNGDACLGSSCETPGTLHKCHWASLGRRYTKANLGVKLSASLRLY